MFIFILNSTNALSDQIGTVSHYAIIACTNEITEYVLQQVSDRIKKRFGLTLDTMTGKTSDPDTFLTISTTTFLK